MSAIYDFGFTIIRFIFDSEQTSYVNRKSKIVNRKS